MIVEARPALHSVVVAIDGEAECGKTTTIKGVETEAAFQRSIIPGLLTGDPTISNFDPSQFSDETVRQFDELQSHMAFSSITKISAGNMFRAVALYKALLELNDQPKSQFEASDTQEVRDLLALPGIKDTLQSDPNIKNQVSHVAKMLGVQALCGTLFCDAITEAYFANGGGNLVIVDARDPIGHMRRNGILGRATGQIDPVSVLPIYIDTPAEVAAQRGKGEYKANLARIEMRRKLDRERDELPVVPPTELVAGYSKWLKLIFANISTGETPISPLRLDNGARTSLGNIQNLSGRLALAAQELGHNLYHRDFPDVLCWDPS